MISRDISREIVYYYVDKKYIIKYSKYMRIRKLPTIPFELIRKTIQGEAPIVMAAFWNILVWWVNKEKMERPPVDRIQYAANIPCSSWSKHEKRIKYLLDGFYDPFIEHWKKCQCMSNIYSKNAEKARKAHAAKRALKKAQPIFMSDTDSVALDNRPTLVPQDYSKSMNFDAKLRENLLKAKKKGGDMPLLSD